MYLFVLFVFEDANHSVAIESNDSLIIQGDRPILISVNVLRRAGYGSGHRAVQAVSSRSCLHLLFPQLTLHRHACRFCICSRTVKCA